MEWKTLARIMPNLIEDMRKQSYYYEFDVTNKGIFTQNKCLPFWSATKRSLSTDNVN